jgi:hypothetical protein
VILPESKRCRTSLAGGFYPIPDDMRVGLDSRSESEDDVEMALEKLYFMCEDEGVSPSSVKKSEWQWFASGSDYRFLDE